MKEEKNYSFANFEKLNEIGIALSKQKDINTLLEMILASARELTGADAGTLYIMNSDAKNLRFAITQNDKLDFLNSARDPESIKKIPPVELYDKEGKPNLQQVISWCVLANKVVNIKDAYNNQDFDFSKTKEFDKNTGYESHSFLCVPMHDHEGEILAAIQLINKIDTNGEVGFFDNIDQELVESLASQAGLVLNNQNLIAGLKNLFDSFVQVIANAIDAKSSHTGAHCRRMPTITSLINQAVNADTTGAYKNVNLTEDEVYEIETAAWLHDCGKIITPPHVMEKQTKLAGLFDKVGWLIARLEVYKRDLKLDLLNKKLASLESGIELDAQAEKKYKEKDAEISNAIDVLIETNKGLEFTPDELIDTVKKISTYFYTDYKGNYQSLVEPEELANLSIRRGTLNEEERKIMESHVYYSKEMLSGLPFPKNMSRVPEFAGGHHEKLNGKGYPNGLKGDEVPLGTRILSLADVFEALTAPDRPYKKVMPLSQALSIMRNMVKDEHLDKDLFNLFITSGMVRKYADEYLKPEQKDIDNADEYLI